MGFIAYFGTLKLDSSFYMNGGMDAEYDADINIAVEIPFFTDGCLELSWEASMMLISAILDWPLVIFLFLALSCENVIAIGLLLLLIYD